MAERIVFLNSLHPDVAPGDADRFLRERDLPLGRSLPSTHQYVTMRVGGDLRSDERPPFDYVTVMDVSSLADYREAIRALEPTAEWNDFLKGYRPLWGHSVAMYGTLLDS